MERCSIWLCVKPSTVWLKAWSRASGRRRNSEQSEKNLVLNIGSGCSGDRLPVARCLLLGSLRKSCLYLLHEAGQGNARTASKHHGRRYAQGDFCEQASSARVSCSP